MVARYTSVILEVGLLQEESARKAHRLEILNQLSRALAGTLDLDRLLNLALGKVLEITEGEQGYIFFGEGLACRASLDRQGQPISEIQVSRSVLARVQRDRVPLAILDIGQDEELQSKASIMIRNIRSVMCVPLLLDDQLVGMTYISSATANKTFTRHDLDLMTAVSAQVALALQNAQAFETIKELNQGLEEKVRERTSELTHAYQELSETQTQLLEAEKLATIGTLAGGVAHEINNPLGAILTNAQLLLMDIEDEEQRDSLSLIEEGAKRCQQIVSALLRYSREAKNTHESVEIRDLVDEALNLFEPQITEANIRILTDLTFVPSIMGDPVELRQVLAHLFFNAIDAIKDRYAGTGGCLQVRLARSLAGVELSIQDDGVGMAPDVIKRVYDPFFTTKKVGSGQGLGLAVCLKIVEKHHGKISAHSQPGQGATFTVILPVP
jgi:signal transduction histidine kinase